MLPIPPRPSAASTRKRPANSVIGGSDGRRASLASIDAYSTSVSHARGGRGGAHGARMYVALGRSDQDKSLHVHSARVSVGALKVVKARSTRRNKASPRESPRCFHAPRR